MFFLTFKENYILTFFILTTYSYTEFSSLIVPVHLPISMFCPTETVLILEHKKRIRNLEILYLCSGDL